MDQNADFTSLTAEGWTNTHLTGNGVNGQTLTASLFGNDTLTAGNGTGDVLNAGEGVDSLTGGTGGDSFVAPDGLAAGSKVTGKGTGNTLTVDGDISGDTIRDIQTLDTGDITLTAAQLNALTGIRYDGNYEGGTPGTIIAETAGTYNLYAKDTTTDRFNLTATATGGTTLIGNTGQLETLTASATGNDTLEGYGNDISLVAGGGIDTFIWKGGSGEVDALNGLTPGSVVRGGGQYTLVTNGDITGDTITAVPYLYIEGGDNDVTLTGTQFAAFGQIFSSGGSGISITTGGTYNLGSRYAGPGGGLDVQALASTGTTLEEDGTQDTPVSDIILSASNAGNDSLTSSYATGVTLGAEGTTGNDTLSVSYGSNNVLDATGSTGNVTLITNDYTDDVLYAGDGTDTITLSNGNGDLVYAGGGADTVNDNSIFGSNTIYGGSGTATIYTDTFGSDTVYGGSGADTIYVNALDTVVGGTGNDTVFLNQTVSGFSLTGGSGSNVLIAGVNVGDLTPGTISNFQSLQVDGSYLSLSESQFTGLTTLSNPNASAASLTLEGTSSGTYSLAPLTVTGAFNLTDGTTGGTTVTLIGNNQAGQGLTAGSGTDTLQAGSGAGDGLIAGTGLDTLLGGTGGDGFFIYGQLGGVNDAPAAGSVFTGSSAASNILYSFYATTISSYTISNIHTLDAYSSVKLTAQEFAQLTTVNYMPGVGASATLIASGAGTFNLNNDMLSGPVNLSALGDASAVTLIGTSQAGQVLTAGGGTDTLTAGSGSGDQLIAGAGHDTLNGGGGTDSFFMKVANGTATIAGGTGDTTTLSGATDTATVTGSGNTISATGMVDTVTDAGTGTNTLSLSGRGDEGIVTNTTSDTMTVGGSMNSIDVTGSVTGTSTATLSGTNALLEFGGAATDKIVFSSASGTLKLDAAASFAGTVQGFAGNDAIDLSNFLFSGTPTITSVTGTGAVDTYTDVTVTDGAQHEVVALLNQTANQYAVNASAYSLVADTSPTPGTLFELATAHDAIYNKALPEFGGASIDDMMLAGDGDARFHWNYARGFEDTLAGRLESTSAYALSSSTQSVGQTIDDPLAGLTASNPLASYIAHQLALLTQYASQFSVDAGYSAPAAAAAHRASESFLQLTAGHY